ncbi:MAG: hypothetical protein AB7I59_14265 [Geminicoccaceae bacterium]
MSVADWQGAAGGRRIRRVTQWKARSPERWLSIKYVVQASILEPATEPEGRMSTQLTAVFRKVPEGFIG